LRLGNGVLAAELAGGRVDVKVLRFESGEGSVAVGGLLQPPGHGRSEAHIAIDRLPVRIGSGQRLVLTGNTTATLDDRLLQVTGRLFVDEGVIEMRGASPPERPGDAAATSGMGRRVSARDGLAGPGPGPVGGLDGPGADAPPVFGIETDVRIDFGRRFRFAGSDLAAGLRGGLRLRGGLAQPLQAIGTVQLSDGTLELGGHPLKVEQGRLVFTGPMDDPAIDLAAVRERLAVEAGIEVAGTALSPAVRLISRPEVADTDKLAWLVLGAGMHEVDGIGQMLALNAVATTLLGDEAARYAPRVAGRPGVEWVAGRLPDAGLESGAFAQSAAGMAAEIGGTAAVLPATGGTLAALGSRMAAQLLLSCEKSLRAVWNILMLQYEITDRLSLSAQAGSHRAADLLGLFPFD
jgi:translocation and assembly module TamB